jgi:hypothetical protein
MAIVWSPATCMPSRRQSSQQATPSRIGAPVDPVRWATSRNAAQPRGRVGEANRRDSHSWSASRTLIAKTPLRVIVRAADDLLLRQTSTSGGTSETDVNAFAVTPHGGSTPAEVTTVTPVANVRSARRNRSESDDPTCGSRTSAKAPSCMSSRGRAPRFRYNVVLHRILGALVDGGHHRRRRCRAWEHATRMSVRAVPRPVRNDVAPPSLRTLPTVYSFTAAASTRGASKL